MPATLKRELKELMFGLARLCLPLPPATAAVVLCYHDVEDRDGFLRQMRRLRALDVDVGGLDALLAPRAPSARTLVVVTFDDGYARLLDTVVPALVAIEIPAVFFLVAGRLGGRSCWAPEYEGAAPVPDATLLDPGQARELAGLGFEIGSHGATHVPLDVPGTDLDDELRGSKHRLEDVVGRPVRALAYPYGRCDATVVAATREAGYEAAFRATPGVPAPSLAEASRWRLPRVVVEANIGGAGLAAYVDGRVRAVGRVRAARGTARLQEILRVLRQPA